MLNFLRLLKTPMMAMPHLEKTLLCLGKLVFVKNEKNLCLDFGTPLVEAQQKSGILIKRKFVSTDFTIPKSVNLCVLT